MKLITSCTLYAVLSTALISALIGSAAKPVYADAPAVTGALSLTSATPNTTGTAFALGFKFTTGPSDITVTSLGYLNDGASGANATHIVGIFDDSSQKLLTPATSITTAGGDLTGTNVTFTYVKLAAPVKLTANTTYDIQGTTSGTGFLTNPTAVAWAYGIVSASAVPTYANSSSLVFPSGTYAANGAANIGPNFVATVAGSH